MVFWKSLRAPRTFVSILAAACSLSLVACVNQRIDQTNADQLIDRFTRGQIHLSTGLAGAGNNVWYEDRYYEASVRGDWKALAKLAIESDDGNDTGYFYLGLAAEGMHYTDAARIYYQLSINASQTNNPPADCTPGVGYLSDRQCHGLSLPRDAYNHLHMLGG